MLNEYLDNTVVMRNDAIRKGQLLLTIWYQAMIEILAQVLVDEDNTKPNHKEGYE